MKASKRTEKQVEEARRTKYPDGLKNCSKCKDPQPLNCFRIAKNTLCQLSSACKGCHNKQSKITFSKRRLRAPEEIAAKQRELRPTGFKTCNDCRREQPLSNFTTNVTLADGLCELCKECAVIRTQGTHANYRSRTAAEIDAKEECLRPSGTKICGHCPADNNVHPLTEFQKCRSHADGRAFYCRRCNSQIQVERRREIQAYRINIKRNTPCAICHFADYRALEFAHLDRETKHVRPSSGRTIPMSAINTYRALEKELKLTRILCANCHARETLAENKALKFGPPPGARAAAKAALIRAEKDKRGGCARCHLAVDPLAYSVHEFDHLPGPKKLACLSNMIGHSYTNEQINEEMSKCQLLCRNCHRVVTWERANEVAGFNAPPVTPPPPMPADYESISGEAHPALLLAAVHESGAHATISSVQPLPASPTGAFIIGSTTSAGKTVAVAHIQPAASTTGGSAEEA